MRRAFFVAWFLGGAGIVLVGELDDRWLVLLVPAGLILVVLGVRLLRDRLAWMAFAQSQSALIPHPSGTFARRFTGAGIVLIGLAWLVGGVVGLFA